MKFISGTVFGLILSVAYVWYDAKLPDWLELPDTLQRSLKSAATDDALYDLDAPLDMRQRALEIYFANQAERAARLDAKLGHPILRELVRRRVVRRAQFMRNLWTGYGLQIEKASLRKVLVTKHGDVDDETLKRRMLMDALQDEAFLSGWLKSHRPAVSPENVYETLLEVSQLSAKKFNP